MADAYKVAADALVDKAGEGFLGHAIVFPITQLYRHYIELRLKEVVASAREIRSEHVTFPKHHRLGDLWGLASGYIRGSSARVSDADLESVGALIGQLAQVDPRGEVFRYPQDDGLSSAFSAVSHVNLRNLREAVAWIAAVLDGVSLIFSVELDWISETRSCAS